MCKGDLRVDLATVEGRLAELQGHIDKLSEALMLTDQPPLAVMRKLRELEAEQSQLEGKRQAISADISGFNSVVGQELLQQWRELEAGISQRLDYDARMTLRDLVNRTFERIDVYIAGIDAMPPGPAARIAQRYLSHLDPVARPIDLVLRFRSGAVRVMRIDAITGEWVSELNDE